MSKQIGPNRDKSMTGQRRTPKKVIERRTGVALWRQIADRIRTAINAGDYSENGRLPPEMVLAETFGVNRHTVRRAIAYLADDGLLKAEQGIGTRIQRRRKLSYPISRRTRFSEGLSDQARDLHIVFVASTHRLADEEIAASLAVPLQHPCLEIEIISLADGQPMSCSVHYFDSMRFGTMDQALKMTGSITKAFASLGLDDYQRISTEISARPASSTECERLTLAPGAIVLETVAVNADSALRPVQFSRTSFAADRISLRIDV
ncbi:MAG: hypothetical protein RIR97_446 [Pseudomonadota bacterium]|jgi:GntR family phosphonate transport system transcriptional regulator